MSKKKITLSPEFFLDFEKNINRTKGKKSDNTAIFCKILPMISMFYQI